MFHHGITKFTNYFYIKPATVKRDEWKNSLSRETVRDTSIRIEG